MKSLIHRQICCLILEITQFMHEEDVVCVAADVVKYLSEAAGLKEKRIFG